MTTFSRSQCPISAEFILAMRAEFGPDVKVTALDENGVVMGEPWADSEPQGENDE